MLSWLSANLINIALILVIALIVCLLICGMRRDRKAGKSSCGGNCASCGKCTGCGNPPARGTLRIQKSKVAAGSTDCRVGCASSQ